jgi:hypothetical protein
MASYLTRKGDRMAVQGINRALTQILFFLAFPLQAGELGVNVYGLSYHFDRDEARRIGVDNEFNPGLGARYRVPRERYEWVFDAGVYRDSGRNTAVVAGAGALWKPTRNIGLGAALAVFNSDTYNRGKTAVAPLPLASYDLGAATLNFTYLPKVSDINDVATLGFWVTLWPARF